MTVRGREFLVGSIFVGLGLLGVYLSLRLNFFSGNRIGPGAFPTILAGVLAFIGLVQLAAAYRMTDRSEAQPFSWRPIAMIVLAVVAFGLLIERTGAVVALAAAALIVGFAGGKPNFKQVAIVYLAILAFAYFIVIKLIGMQLPLFWQ